MTGDRRITWEKIKRADRTALVVWLIGAGVNVWGCVLMFRQMWEVAVGHFVLGTAVSLYSVYLADKAAARRREER